MTKRLIHYKRVHFGIALLLLAGCSPSIKVEEFPETASSTEEVQRLVRDLNVAESRQVHVFAPTAYKEALASLDSAKSKQESGEDSEDILHDVAIGRAYFDQANKSSETALANFSEIASARSAAIKAGAPRYFPKDLATVDSRLMATTKKAEGKNAPRDNEELRLLQKAYLDVELKSIQLAHLGPAMKIIDQAIKEGAKENAKQSLALAEKAVRDAESYIIANRYQTSEIQSRSQKALLAAGYLLKITHASKAGKVLSSEEMAIMMEGERSKLAEEQYKLEAERRAATVVAGTVRDLSVEKAFNQQFVLAGEEFTKDEADIYRQGDKLLIRLKTLEFPVNQSVLQSANFVVLGKLAKVIRHFEAPSVSVEGHTDSTGSASLNKKLALERAQAVANYLISSKATEAQKVTVMGWGSDRPIASNMTAIGKAQNRRVDVVISSAMVSH